MNFLQKLWNKPITRTLTVTSENGFHLRPIANFVSTAKKYVCTSTLNYATKKVNAKNINEILSLSLNQNDNFTLTCQGKDAKIAMESLVKTFQKSMHTTVPPSPLSKISISPYQSQTIQGECIAEGIAIAPIYQYLSILSNSSTVYNFHDAIQHTRQDLLNHRKDTHAEVFLAQEALLSALSHNITDIETFEDKINEECHALLDTKMATKVDDYQDILQRVYCYMGKTKELLLPNEPFILLAESLLPSQIEYLSHSEVQGVILTKTSSQAHSAILLKAEQIPTLIVLNFQDIKTEQSIILDCTHSLVVPIPTKKELKDATLRQKKEFHKTSLAFQKRFDTAKTSKGKHINIFANITDIPSLVIAKKAGAEGIGLLRTEFLFTQNKPTFQKQVELYQTIFSEFEDITVRTLDVGGDKSLPYLHIPPEDNPFLGIRGVRLFKTHPKIMGEQLHALFVAAKQKPLKIMFPMVSTVEEFLFAKHFAQTIAKEHHLDISNIRFGMMIEIPSVLFLLDKLDNIVDFYSIGTNDLTQYLFAIERTHLLLKVDPLSSVIFDAIQMIVNKTSKPVSLCGELASDTKALPKLLEIGIETLSVSPKHIANIKEHIRHV